MINQVADLEAKAPPAGEAGEMSNEDAARWIAKTLCEWNGVEFDRETGQFQEVGRHKDPSYRRLARSLNAARDEGALIFPCFADELDRVLAEIGAGRVRYQCVPSFRYLGPHFPLGYEGVDVSLAHRVARAAALAFDQAGAVFPSDTEELVELLQELRPYCFDALTVAS